MASRLIIRIRLEKIMQILSKNYRLRQLARVVKLTKTVTYIKFCNRWKRRTHRFGRDLLHRNHLKIRYSIIQNHSIIGLHVKNEAHEIFHHVVVTHL
jgi:hypothetical protein